MDLDELDPGIREAVRVLRNSGIDTLSSCEGRQNPGDAKTLDMIRGGMDRIMATGLMSQSTAPLPMHLLLSELQSKRASPFAR